MKRNKVTVTVIPDVKRTKTNQRTALNLRLTYKGRRKYYSTGFEASKAECMTINSAEAKGKLRKIKNAIAEIEVDAQKCCDDIIPFSFPRFEYLFFSQKIIFQNLRSAYVAYMEQLKNNQQYSSAVSYQTALNNIEKFRRNLQLTDITVDFLEAYEKWLLNQGKSITTVGIHTRTLRAVLNVAKDNGAITPQDYPFGRRKYIVPTGKNTRRRWTSSKSKKYLITQLHQVPRWTGQKIFGY